MAGSRCEVILLTAWIEGLEGSVIQTLPARLNLMEFLTIFLSSLLTLLSPAGVVLDRVAEKSIRDQFAAVEQLSVRVDSAPSYQIVQGKAERIRLAGRGLFPVPDVRLDVLELETDPININRRRLLRRGRIRLEAPLRAGVRLVVKAEDVNRALRSPTVTNWLREIGSRLLLGEGGAEQVQGYEFRNLQIAFLDKQRFRLQATLQTSDTDSLDLLVESGIEVVAGHQFRLVAPVVRLNGADLPESLVNAIATGIPERLDLRQLENAGITTRILKWQADTQQLELAAFVQVRTDRNFKE